MERKGKEWRKEGRVRKVGRAQEQEQAREQECKEWEEEFLLGLCKGGWKERDQEGLEGGEKGDLGEWTFK